MRWVGVRFISSGLDPGPYIDDMLKVVQNELISRTHLNYYIIFSISTRSHLKKGFWVKIAARPNFEPEAYISISRI
jgi:hypothetical protein